ncbi:MAG: 2OG-Fe(II) oxygenase [Candidatus Binatia bacterium]
MSANVSGLDHTLERQIAHVPHLLSDVERGDIVKEPFAHIVRQNALPVAMYEELAGGFPSLEMILGGRSDVGTNVAVRLSIPEVLNDCHIPRRWREFFAYHTSVEYWREVVRVFSGEFRHTFPDLEKRIGRAYEDWRVVRRGFDGAAEVRLDCQFVMNTPVVKPSSVKPPHVDLGDKIVSALLYFRDPTDTATGGDLDLYRWRRGPRFVKHRVLERDIERVETVPYAANTFLCFVNSEVAVHGVSPRSVTTVPRRYINFIAELPIKAFKPQQLNPLQQFLFSTKRAATRCEDRSEKAADGGSSSTFEVSL